MEAGTGVGPIGFSVEQQNLLWVMWRRNLKYHRYQPLDPSPQIQDLLDYLDSGTSNSQDLWIG